MACHCPYVIDRTCGGYAPCTLKAGHDGPHRYGAPRQLIAGSSWLTLDEWKRSNDRRHGR